MIEAVREEQNCLFKFTNYVDNNSLALIQVDDKGNLEDVITVNIHDANLKNKYCQFIDTNNQPDDIVEWLEQNGFGHPTHNFEHSGFCIYPEFEFDKKLVKANMEKEKTHA